MTQTIMRMEDAYATGKAREAATIELRGPSRGRRKSPLHSYLGELIAARLDRLSTDPDSPSAHAAIGADGSGYGASIGCKGRTLHFHRYSLRDLIEGINRDYFPDHPELKVDLEAAKADVHALFTALNKAGDIGAGNSKGAKR